MKILWGITPVLIVVTCACLLVSSASALDLPGPAPGKAQARLDAESMVLENTVISRTWSVRDGQLRPYVVRDRLNGGRLTRLNGESFFLVFDWFAVKASDLSIVGEPEVVDLKPDLKASRLAERFGGKALKVKLHSEEHSLYVNWRAELRDGSNYVREVVWLRSTRGPAHLVSVALNGFD